MEVMMTGFVIMGQRCRVDWLDLGSEREWNG